jgi:S1-C subfamily serine protease
MPGETVRCQVWRNGKTVNLNVELTERPSPEEAAAAQTADTTEFSRQTLGLIGSNWRGRIIDAGIVSRIRGVMVGFVRKDSPAARAGIEVGDLIVAVNGKATPDADTFENAVRAGDLRRGVELVILNETREKRATLKK